MRWGIWLVNTQLPPFQLLARLFGVWDFWDQDTMLYVIHVGPKHGRIWEIKGSANTQSIIGTLNLLDGTLASRKKGTKELNMGLIDFLNMLFLRCA
jgi:hypothetical protein